jgi:hypothetical protein
LLPIPAEDLIDQQKVEIGSSAGEAGPCDTDNHAKKTEGKEMDTGAMKHDNLDGTMTAQERTDLARVVRLRAKIRRSDVDEHKARQLAKVEQQLAKIYSKHDKRWAAITEATQKVVDEAHANIAKICVDGGTVPEFGPRLYLGWEGRGENAFAARRAELRKVATTQIEANARAAKMRIDRAEASLLEQITARGLRTDDAKKFLESMPSIEELMPSLEVGELDKKLPLPKDGYHYSDYYNVDD